LRLLLKGVQDHDAIRKRRQVDHTKRTRAVADAQLANARPDRLGSRPR
jgi:hypothetical protein